MFKGSMVAIVTPFKNGKIDEKALIELIKWHLEAGTSGIIPCGSTGESATLSFEEHERVIKLTVEIVNKKIPVIAGTGSNNTAEAIKLTKYAKTAGADAVLLITPYYNKPTEEGLYQHFSTIANKVNIPIVLYNVPSRTGVNLLPQTVKRLAEIDNIVAIKEASGNLAQMAEIVQLCRDKITLLSGDDNLTLPILAIGGKGVISVVANIIPHKIVEMVNAYEFGNIIEAQKIYFETLPLCNAMFYETNPIPVKTTLALMGKINSELRLPLCKISPSNLEKLKTILKEHKLI